LNVRANRSPNTWRAASTQVGCSIEPDSSNGELTLLIALRQRLVHMYVHDRPPRVRPKDHGREASTATQIGNDGSPPRLAGSSAPKAAIGLASIELVKPTLSGLADRASGRSGGLGSGTFAPESHRPWRSYDGEAAERRVSRYRLFLGGSNRYSCPLTAVAARTEQGEVGWLPS
jgi:hypothetical protein